MSFTYTKEGKELQYLLNNQNWQELFSMLNAFRYMRNFDLDSQQWLNLFMDMKEDFLKSLLSQTKTKATKQKLYDWFMRFIATYENITLTDLEIAKIKQILNNRFKAKKKR